MNVSPGINDRLLSNFSMMRRDKCPIRLSLASLLLLAVTAVPASAEVTKPTDMPVIELPQEEVLDTIALDRPVHFITPQASNTIAEAGPYRVQPGESSGMKLIALPNRAPMLVDALSITHETGIAESVALYVRVDEQFPHVLLLLPDGRGLEAVGSYDGTRISAGRESRPPEMHAFHQIFPIR